MTTSPVSRRQFVTALAAGTVVAALPGTNARASGVTSPKWRRYAHATVIDALGGPGSANKPDALLDAADLADVRTSGVTAVNLTVGSVGSYAHDYDGAIEQIAHWDN